MSMIYRTAGSSSGGGGGSSGSQVFISKTTLSSSSSAEVTLDSTYPIIVLKLVEITVSADNTNLLLDVSTDGGSSYTTPITSAPFYAENRDTTYTGAFAYDDSADATDSTTGATFVLDTDAPASLTGASISGEITLYKPAGSNYKKIYTTAGNDNIQGGVTRFTNYTSWMTVKTTSALNRIRIKTSANNMATGDVLFYGIKDS